LRMEEGDMSVGSTGFMNAFNTEGKHPVQPSRTRGVVDFFLSLAHHPLHSILERWRATVPSDGVTVSLGEVIGTGP